MLKNITLSAEEHIIQLAREKALQEKKSLNSKFREWLKSYVNLDKQNYDQVMQQLSHIKAGGKFSRDELNER